MGGNNSFTKKKKRDPILFCEKWTLKLLEIRGRFLNHIKTLPNYQERTVVNS